MNALKQPQERDTSRITVHEANVSTKQYKAKMAIQRVCGVVLLILAIVSAIISNDSTAAVMIIPMGLYAILTKDYIMCF